MPEERLVTFAYPENESLELNPDSPDRNVIKADFFGGEIPWLGRSKLSTILAGRAL
jgi:hypothetical protein